MKGNRDHPYCASVRRVNKPIKMMKTIRVIRQITVCILLDNMMKYVLLFTLLGKNNVFRLILIEQFFVTIFK